MLRYKGKPERGSNTIADNLPQLCFCRFVAVGIPLDKSECSVHLCEYGCDECNSCSAYRPSRVKRTPKEWPVCMCGHIAQEHNQVV